jgi:KDO2-lipid IV(A) lauroyltransferase
MGFTVRGADGRHTLTVEPPLEAEEPRAADAAERLTRAHAARLEYWVRQHPELWFWLHRRWKTAAPAGAAVPAATH